MIPGEVIAANGEIELNAGRETVTLSVANTGDRPIQVGSHYHFYETNEALAFDRAEAGDEPVDATGKVLDREKFVVMLNERFYSK